MIGPEQLKSTVGTRLRAGWRLGFGLFLGVGLYAGERARAEGYSISNPGPDLANFPNSAFTLTNGRAYVELTPDVINTPSPGMSGTYNAGYLLRYGLIDDLELRLASDGYTEVRGADGTRGMSSQAFGIKWHVANEDPSRYLPAFGIEVALETNWASPALRQGWNPGLSLNFDHELPFGIALEYNAGFIRQLSDSGAAQLPAQFAWALQRELFGPVDIFVNGYGILGDGLPMSAVGAGLLWAPLERLALFTNCAAGLTAATPATYVLVGLAVAF